MSDYIYDRFAVSFPKFEECVISWEPKGKNSITLVLDDGCTWEYNILLDAIRQVHLYDGTEESYKRGFSYRLADMMVDKGFDQTHLSEVSGVSQQSISNYIHKKSLPTIYVLDKLARALDCSVSDLIDF